MYCTSNKTDGSFSNSFDIPKTAIDFSFLKFDSKRKQAFEKALIKYQDDCQSCFPAFSKLYYPVASRYTYVAKIPVKKFLKDSKSLYSELIATHKRCLERCRTNGACIVCQHRMLRLVVKRLVNLNFPKWRPPLKFANAFGFLANDLVLVWKQCMSGCLATEVAT